MVGRLVEQVPRHGPEREWLVRFSIRRGILVPVLLEAPHVGGMALRAGEAYGQAPS